MHVSQWLASLPTTKLVAPVAVKIGRETYHGASYFSVIEHVSHEPVLYLLGNLPASYRRSRAVAYRFTNPEHVPMANGDTCGCEDCSQDWYLAAFADAAVAAAFPNFHPFGAWFQIRKWPTNGPTIDAFHARPYRRVTIKDVS